MLAFTDLGDVCCLLSEDEVRLELRGLDVVVVHGRVQLGLLEEALARLRAHQVHQHLQRVRLREEEGFERVPRLVKLLKF